MKKLICAVVILMLAVGSSWAFDNAYHVKQAPNKKGDLLIFPVYFTTPDGWETKLTVTNTSDRYSVVAKVVYRSHYWTDEMLDHLIYLSPRDVWIGYVKTIGGKVSLWSDDDSILASSTTFASAGNPVIQEFFTNNMCTSNAWNPDSDGGADSAERGYVEVIETWYGDTRNYPAVVVGGVALDQNPPKVDKQYLLRLYHPENGAVQPAGLTTVAGAAVNSTAIDHTINVLTGVLELQHSAMSNLTSAIEATVFADFDVTQYMRVNEISGLDSFNGQNTLGEVEAALSKDDIAMPYVNDLNNGTGTIHMFNFPTKQGYAWNGTRCVYTPKGPFWQWHRDGIVNNVIDYNQCLEYTAPIFDLTELDRETTGLWSGGERVANEMCEELEWVYAVSGNYFAEGWQEYRFNGLTPVTGGLFTNIPAVNNRPNSQITFFDPDRISANFQGMPRNPMTGNEWLYTGVPVIPVVLHVKRGAGISMFYGAYSDGEVYASNVAGLPDVVADAWLPDYQYWNYMDALGLNNTGGANNNAGATTYPQASTFPIDQFPSVVELP